MTDIFRISQESLKTVLVPIVKLCMRGSIGAAEVCELLKKCFIEAAKEEIGKRDGKLNTSRISVMTGIQRREVQRLQDSTSKRKESLTIVSRVIGQWENDKRFCSNSGTPRTLILEGKNSEFAKLVSSVTTDMHPGTVLFELKRQKIIEIKGNSAKLVRKTQSLKKEPEKAFQVIAADISDLIDTTFENLNDDNEPPHLQVRTEYDNVFIEALPTIKQWLLEHGSTFHKQARDYISQFDQDLNPHIRKKAGGKVSVSAFSSIKEGD